MTDLDAIPDFISKGEYEKVVNLLENIPLSDLTYKNAGRLSVAYNNLEMYPEAEDTLMSFWESGEDDPSWNYYLGYSLLFQGKKIEARQRLMRSVKLNPSLVEAQRLLHLCICYDGINYLKIDDKVIQSWIRDMIGGEIIGNQIIGQKKTRISVTIAQEPTKKSPVAILNFYIMLPDGNKIFETASGFGDNARDAYCAAIGNFYQGLYSGIAYYINDEYAKNIKDNEGEEWKVYSSSLLIMGRAPLKATWETYWELIRNKIADYLGAENFNYIKIYAAKYNDVVTTECRINDKVSFELSQIIQEETKRWPNTVFSAQKQFFVIKRESDNSPLYTTDEMRSYVSLAIKEFEDKRENTLERIKKWAKDEQLAEELYVYLPEICGEISCRAFFTSDWVKIIVGNQNYRKTKWSLPTYFMIHDAFMSNYQEHKISKESVSICETKSKIKSFEKQLEKEEITISPNMAIELIYTFSDDYVLR